MPPVLISASDIAKLAGVGLSAVSNWRNRYPDFPLPTEGDRYNQGAVTEWLAARGKLRTDPSVLAVDQAVERLFVRLRSNGVDDPVLLLLQLLFVRQCEENSRLERGARTAGYPYSKTQALNILWGRLREAPSRYREIWNQEIDKLGELEPKLARALTLESWVGDAILHDALLAIAYLDLPVNELGTVATAMLRQSQDVLGIRAAWAATPESLVRLWLALLSPLDGAVYDPACGSAMFLAEVWRERQSDQVHLYGQEINERSWRLAYLHLALLGARFELEAGDTLRDDRFRGLRAGRIVLDPPFGGKLHESELFNDDRWVFGMPTASADWIWAQHVLYHLAERGIGVMLSAPGALFRGGRDVEVRAGIVRSGKLDAVIELPPGLYTGTSTATALLVFSAKRPNRSDRVLFVNARQLGTRRRGQTHELEPDDVKRIIGVVEEWREGRFTPVPGFAAAAAIEDVLDNDASLLPSRYVEFTAAVTEIEEEPIEERLARLRAELHELMEFAEAAERVAIASVDAFSTEQPAQWPAVKLGEVLAVPPQTGSRQVSEGTGTPIPYVDARVVSGGALHLASLPDAGTYGDPKGRFVSRGDVLLSSRGIDPANRPIGCTTVEFDDRAAYSESLLRLSPDPERLDPDYLRLFLTSRQGRGALAAATTGSTIANLRPRAVAEIEVPLPTVREQREIVQRIRQIENGVAAVNRLTATFASVHDTLREGVVVGLVTLR